MQLQKMIVLIREWECLTVNFSFQLGGTETGICMGMEQMLKHPIELNCKRFSLVVELSHEASSEQKVNDRLKVHLN